MRWSPFSVFSAKRVAIKEDWSPQRRDELYNVVEYRWLRDPFSLQSREPASAVVMAADGSGSLAPASPSASPSAQPSSAGSAPVATLWERREQCGPSVNDIRTTQREGIDNTGNFHWPTEDILCHYMARRWFERDAGEAVRIECTDSGDNDITGERVAAPSPQQVSGALRLRLKEPVAFLEIGAGCGLAAFVLAWCGARCSPIRASTSVALCGDRQQSEVPAVRIVATDGNSRVVETLSRNVALQFGDGGAAEEAKGEEGSADGEAVISSSSQRCPSCRMSPIVPMVLHWDSAEQFDAACAALGKYPSQGKGDGGEGFPQSAELPRKKAVRKVLFGADCLFFETFHNQLADLVIRFHSRFGEGGSTFDASAEEDYPHPLTLLMAPSRGGSLERFEAIIASRIAAYNSGAGEDEAAPRRRPLSCRREENFDPFITDLHDRLVAAPSCGDEEAVDAAARANYNPSRHLPVLLVIE